MQTRFSKDQIRVVKAAEQLKRELLPHIAGPISFFRDLEPQEEESDGWMVPVARLRHQPRIRWELDLWFDTSAGRGTRNLYVGFWCGKDRFLNEFVKKLPSSLKPARNLKDQDVLEDQGYWIMKEPLQISESFAPIRENYNDGDNFYGVYDLEEPIEHAADIAWSNASRAADFVKDVLRCLPDFIVNDAGEDYPQVENRQQVVMHLRRERSQTLARVRKERDGFRCQVCRFTLAEIYGELGCGFAEAHHVAWLSKLDGPTETNLDSLRTVCPNCHRMLHKMSGRPDDLEKLQELLRLRGMIAGA